MSIADFEVLDKLGEGAYSSVYKVHRKADRKEYALKKVKISNLSDKEKENALNEVRLLASVNHPNIIAYREAFLDQPSNSLCIVMEYADDGDVFQLISAHKKRKEYIDEERIWTIAIQVVRGLKELHRLKILHRDMKSANIFLTKDGKAKLGDMNVSKIAKKGLLYTQTGTPYYASPEVWREKPYNHKSDIWSLGCVLFEMCALKPPFRAEDMEGLYKKVIKGTVPKIPNCYSKQLFDLIKEMLTVNPDLRPSCQQLVVSASFEARASAVDIAQPSSHSVMINTIKLPSNLYYLTDILPRPNYNTRDRKRNQTLPDKELRVGVLPSLPKFKNGSRHDHKSLKDDRRRSGRDQQSELERQQREKSRERQREEEERVRYQKTKERERQGQQVNVRERKRRAKQELQRKKVEIQAIYGKRNSKDGRESLLQIQVQGHRMKDDERRELLMLPKLKS